MSSLLKDLTNHNPLKQYQRVKLTQNEKEITLLIPLELVENVIDQINNIETISEENILDIVNKNNLIIE